MASIMEYTSHRSDEREFNLREWDRKARVLRENPNSRRFSASYITSFREEARSFRSSVSISSTASSPAYSLKAKDEIDPSTYSFTTALRALQAKSVYNNWNRLTPDGFALNSKWNEAEKYICNPLSGEVPMECLSAKTLSGRSFRNLTRKITMSAPLVYPVHPPQNIQTKPTSIEVVQEEDHPKPAPVMISDNGIEDTEKDVRTQSTQVDLSSGSLSPISTPPIAERSLNRHVEDLVRLKDEQQVVKIRVEDQKEKVEERRSKREEENDGEGKGKEKRQSGCLSWMRRKAKRVTPQSKKKQHHVSQLCSSS